MPYRDPNNYQYGFVVWVVILGIWGAVVSVYRSRKQGKNKKWYRYIGEVFLSFTAAFLAGLLCHYLKVDAAVDLQPGVFFVFNYPMTCIAMWAASAMGTRLFDLLDEIYFEARIEILKRVKGEVK